MSFLQKEQKKGAELEAAWQEMLKKWSEAHPDLPRL